MGDPVVRTIEGLEITSDSIEWAKWAAVGIDIGNLLDLARLLRDEPFESRGAFRRNLNELCDELDLFYKRHLSHRPTAKTIRPHSFSRDE